MAADPLCPAAYSAFGAQPSLCDPPTIRHSGGFDAGPATRWSVIGDVFEEAGLAGRSTTQSKSTTVSLRSSRQVQARASHTKRSAPPRRPQLRDERATPPAPLRPPTHPLSSQPTLLTPD